MEFLDHIKEDYMILRKCISDNCLYDYFGKPPYDIKKILNNKLIIYRKSKELFKTDCPFYWEEMAEFEFELNQNNLKLDANLNLDDYKIYNSDLIDKTDYGPFGKSMNYYSIIIRLEIFTYDYEKIHEEKEELNKEILLESQKRICNPRFIDPTWENLEKEIDEYFDNH